ncbi:protein-(glutamine-N5) methyltransferase, release factor-specific [Methylobacterium sp. Leaf456]|uniref:peptide chain release factor N(5)-glutamine methyltransferase n=1 Tax=Methylobacterium sp. Leaf456 TaxID=1736382 RepID=UPI0006F89090|nr:peptide chain release factor N(5)-glutamine methyltransferase [Methylobacterium sp. Leaf456]KQT46669.1 protein-(glutamine-N5) methyltransferase, release factor-specific [Methylobacterium sp. Leaf456]
MSKGLPPLPPTLPRAEALRQLTQAFSAAGLANPRGDARFLTEHALGLSSSELILQGRHLLGETGARALGEAAGRRLAGEPVARIIGAWEFWGLPFRLSPETLVPRPDTETLVEASLRLFPEPARPLRLVDLGTGSGCILVALLHERTHAFGIGLDSSRDALATARENARANGVGARAAFLHGSWLDALAGPFDLIVSNPPYIAADVIPILDAEVREHDPMAALDGGPDGLDAYRAIFSEVARRPGLLAPGGALAVEIGYDQAEAVTALGVEAGFAEVTLARDLAGHPRVVTLRPSLSIRG